MFIETFSKAWFSFQDGHFENTYYSEFISNLVNIKYAGGELAHIGKQTKLMICQERISVMLLLFTVVAGQAMNISSLDVRSMLPENLNHFFRYQGSLTTPPCYESILWTVFDTPITLSHNQVQHTESLCLFGLLFCCC